MARPADLRIASRFHAQHHVVSRAQALEDGCTPRMISRRLASGAWLAVAPSVYRAAGAPPSLRSDLLATCLHLGQHCVASHEAAAALHRFEAAPPPAVVVTVLRPVTTRSPLARVHVTGRLPSEHWTVVDGVPITSVPRTLVDLGAVVRPGRLARIVDDALARRLVRYDDLDEAFGVLAARGRPGIAAMRAVLAERGPGVAVPESELEARLLALLAAHGIADPVRQAPLPGVSVPGRVDLAWPSARLVVEADGRRWHARFDRFDDDRRRDNAAVLAGWRVLRFTWHAVTARPEVVVDEVRRALRAAA